MTGRIIRNSGEIMKVIAHISRLIVKHEIHICGLPDSCPEYGKHIYQFKIGDESTFLKSEEIDQLIAVLQEMIK